MKQLTTKQFTILIFLIVFAQKIFMLPTLILKTSGKDGYISILIFILIEILILAIILFTMRIQQRRNMYELLDYSASKIGSKIICLLMLVFLFLKLMLLMGELRVFFNITLSETLTEWLAIVPLCGFLFFISVKTLRGIGRLSEFFIIFILGAFLILVTLLFINLDFSFLKPFLENGLKPPLKSVYLYPMYFGDLSILVICLGQVKTSKHYIKIGLISAILSSVLVMFFSILLFTAYSNIPHLINYNHNVSNTLLFSSNSYVNGRYDIPIFCVLVFALLIQISLVFYSITRHINYVFKFKNNKIPSFILIAISYLVFIFLFNQQHILLNLSTSVFARISAIFNEIAIPLFLLISAIIMKIRSKNSGYVLLKNNNNYIKPAIRKRLKNEK